MNTQLLAVEDLVVGYGSANVLEGVSVKAEEGRITCLLGANGVGKSTLIKAIFGLVPVRRGRVRFRGHDITGWDTHRIVAQGLAAIPEGNRVFPRMSVLDNLMAGAYLERSPAKIAARLERVLALFPRLAERRSQFAGTLSGGERSMLSIGRGLMSDPRLLVIDEPSLGLSPLFVKENFRLIRELCCDDCAILLVEQNVKQTLEVSHYGYVISQGAVAVEGTGECLRDSAEVGNAYFGVEAAAH
ncbi:MAG: ABC transporter ATP-binding protein [Bordetella sp. SCN 67-23]|nr:ABC transporter ATP-binding protein [Burkholderiales bacterium]ODS70469.1 MAG: ABC transporter ATP-binding protein [Bordetella sp. SCN 67-23]ODU93867.1 MAG: ABC transporter ATP-binding protein [Bordetella sp. SCN 68-11]OJW94204.1 MAG: ABC transporter ATP-binding protein [Burkholderiales bacterium 67-32]